MTPVVISYLIKEVLLYKIDSQNFLYDFDEVALNHTRVLLSQDQNLHAIHREVAQRPHLKNATPSNWCLRSKGKFFVIYIKDPYHALRG